MRIFVFAAASAAVLCFAAAAQAAPMGEVGLNYSRNNLEIPGAEADADAFQGAGSIYFGDEFAGQFDGSITRYDSDDLGGDATAISGTGHFKYNSGGQQLGLFAGVQNNDDATLWGLGVEGKTSSDLGSLYMQFGYGKADDLDDVDFWAVRAEGRLFVNDNLRVGVGGGYTRADAPGGDLDMWNLGADVEFQPASMPFSVFAAYERGEMKDIDLSSDTFRVGARFTFGGTLRERDRAGVGQGAVTNLFGGSLGAGILAVAGEVL
jgi:opacity protein-like surface antigen